MRLLAPGLVFLMHLGGSSAAQAAEGQRTFDGEEASAIRCANMMALTGITLHRASLMSEDEKDVLLGISILILERHVSGNWTEKKRAMEVMRDRRDLDETLEDYQRNAPLCLDRFSIN